MTTANQNNIRVAASAQQSAADCSSYILGLLRERLDSQARATIAVSGGSTPKPLFADLAKADLNWSKVDIFQVDERCVPPDNDQSNYKMLKECLLDPARVPAANVHRIQGEIDPAAAARAYVAEIRAFFQLKDEQIPSFDVVHRGMGADAHTASLFPGEPLIADRTGIAAHVWVEKLKMARVTLLPAVLLAAKYTILQVEKADKAEALRNVLYGPEDPLQFPCQIAARGAANAVWFVDRDAASQLAR